MVSLDHLFFPSRIVFVPSRCATKQSFQCTSSYTLPRGAGAVPGGAAGLVAVEPEEVECGDEGDQDGGDPGPDGAGEPPAGLPAEGAVHGADPHPLQLGLAALGDERRLQRRRERRQHRVRQRLVAGEDAPGQGPAARRLEAAAAAPRRLQQAVPGGHAGGDHQEPAGA
jgi:hypothetical protein